MKILVTGATGYIGSHICKALKERGHWILATDYNDDQNDISMWCDEYVNIDIRKLNGKYHNVDKVVHVAARTKVGPSVHEPWDYYDTNVNGTKNIIEAFPCWHFIYCSTGSAFNPGSNAYAATKWGGELITQQFYEKYSLVRFYNVSGNDGFYKFDDEVSHLIRKAARVANSMGNDHPFMPVFGTDYDTRDGTCVRNYTHVKDIVDGIVRITEADATNKVECLGSKHGVTVKEVIDTMKKVSGKEFLVMSKERRPGDIPVSTIPLESRFFKETQTLEDMCRDALEYEK